MNSEKIQKHYKQRIETSQENLHRIKHNIYYLGSARLAIVLLAFGLSFGLRNYGTEVVLLIIFLALPLFLWLVLKNHRQQKKKMYQETSILCDKDEVKALNYDFSAFDGATEQIDGSHPFTIDLDVFGHKSLFQSINRTRTIAGKNILSSWFSNPLQDKNNIELRQQAIQELTEDEAFVHHFQVTGFVNPGQRSDKKEITDFIRKQAFLKHQKLWKALVYIFPCIWMILIVLSFFFTISPSVYIATYLVTFAISESQVKKINDIQAWVGKKVNILSTYSELIQAVEQKEVNTPQLKELRSRFFSNNQQASVIIKQLARLAGELDQRTNLLVHALLNPLILWDIKKSLQIEKWKDVHGTQLNTWLDTLGEYDAFCSLSTFSYNHPGYTFPVITEKYFEIQGKSLGHPLMREDTCIKNDIHIVSHPYYMIVTGANMAGKSTYLRTVGVNFLLACIGAPVCAESLQIYPTSLVTSLRTTDSLTDNESYFFAELKRLKMIIDELSQGKQLFIILDEILKGTNSVDKQKGSLALLKQFVRLQSCGIIATHDLLLGSLEKEFPNHIKNYRFEADITNDQLTFSYLLREGIAQNMNACFLMEKMGIIL